MTTWDSDNVEVKRKELWEEKSPVDDAGWFSKIFYNWTYELLRFSRKGKLSPNNIGKIQKEESAKKNLDSLKRSYEQFKGKSDYALFKAILHY